jgi:hypothetical protein
LLHEIFLILDDDGERLVASFVAIAVLAAAAVVATPLFAGRFLMLRTEAASFRIKGDDLRADDPDPDICSACRLDDVVAEAVMLCL